MNIFATQIEWNTQMNCAKWLEHHQNRHYVHYILFPDPLQKKIGSLKNWICILSLMIQL